MDYSLKKKWIKIRIKYKTVQTVDSYTKKKAKQFTHPVSVIIIIIISCRTA